MNLKRCEIAQPKGVLEVIKTRRSIRKFRDDPVSCEVVMLLLESIQWAPSGSNCQPWVVIVIRNKGNIQNIKLFSPGLQGNPALLLVLCNDKSVKSTTATLDIAMAAENVLLTAADHGMGSCVVRGFNTGAIQHLLDLPSHVIPELIIALGYPAEPDIVPPTRRSIDEFVYWEGYGGQKE